MQVGEKKWKHVIYSKAKVYARKKKVWTSICQRGGRVFLPALSNPSSLTLANCWALVAANSIVKNRTCRPFITVKDQWLIVILKKWLLMSFYLGCCHREECARAAMGTGFLYLSGLFVPRESTSRSRHVLFGSLREHQSFFIIWVGIRDKKILLFMFILKWIDSFNLSPIRINKYKSITF